MYRHLRQFLMVQIETGKELYFRFYDPRVLRLFLLTCTPAQLQSLFGPTRYFMLEDETPDFGLYFWQEGGVLKRKRVNRDQMELALTKDPLNTV